MHGGMHALNFVTTSTATIYQESLLGRETTCRNNLIPPIPSIREKANLPSTRGASLTHVKPRDRYESLDETSQNLQPRKTDDGTTYCQAQTNTFIVITWFDRAHPGVSTFLNDCLNAVQRAIDNGNTGLIPSDGWFGPLGRRGLRMHVFSENDHQTTYLVLLSALQELISWMSDPGYVFGTVGFQIWDGQYQVGHGSIDG